MFLDKSVKVSKSNFSLKSRTQKIFELESFTLYKNCNLCCDLRCTAKFSAFGYSGPVDVVGSITAHGTNKQPPCRARARRTIGRSNLHAVVPPLGIRVTCCGCV